MISDNAKVPLLEVKGVTKDYRLGKTSIHALRGVDFTVEAGDFLSIVGPSGCGKTTLLNIIGCIDRPSSGTVLLDGVDVSTFDDDGEADTRLARIGFIFQSFNLVGVLDVRENIEFPLILAKLPKAERAKRIDRLVELVGLGDFVKHKPDELSGGQRQRVAIARALVNRPSLVIADEPTANLDSATSTTIMEAMKALNDEEGVTFIFSTHNELIERYAKRVLSIRDGLITGERRLANGVRFAAAATHEGDAAHGGVSSPGAPE
ncbi:MAG TPA: ABC transporter ATP-binding protein [Rectinemataceae bacterium]|nr:ABC transporter ATP-binding protein [Rectinemataceae bacterium]